MTKKNEMMRIQAEIKKVLTESNRKYWVNEVEEEIQVHFVNEAIVYIFDRTPRGWVLYPDLSNLVELPINFSDTNYVVLEKFIDKLNFEIMQKNNFKLMSIFEKNLQELENVLKREFELAVDYTVNSGEITVELNKAEKEVRRLIISFVTLTLNWEVKWDKKISSNSNNPKWLLFYEALIQVVDGINLENQIIGDSIL